MDGDDDTPYNTFRIVTDGYDDGTEMFLLKLLDSYVNWYM